MDFLFEIGTEELPAKRLRDIGESLAENIVNGLQHHSLQYQDVKFFATPRRLAVLITKLANKQPDHDIEMRGPAVKAAYDHNGEPTIAAQKFAENCGITVDKLERQETPKGAWIVCKVKKIGLETEKLLPNIITQALKSLPLARQMRWNEGNHAFSRPVHWVVMIYGSQVVPANLFGIDADNKTRGHRFLAPQEIIISDPAKYEEILEQQGKVIADFDKRSQKIRDAVSNAIKTGKPLVDENLLTENTGLVEWPVALVGKFDEHFLEVPQEVLITSMQHQQRCFPVVNSEGKLLPFFILISNIESKNPQRVIEGNERVIRARLTDAEFFYRTDLQFTLDSYLDRLKQTVFQNKLGSMYDKTQRLVKLAEYIAKQIDGNEAQANRAALLSKCDLLSTMVWEFPELQGIMGYYYALQQFEPDPIAIAIKEQYLPRFAKDVIPTSDLGCALALADRADTLVGLFGINKIPTGEKDPLGLRRAAVGVLRICLEKNLNLNLFELLSRAKANYTVTLEDTEMVNKVIAFIYERYRAWYLDNGGNANIFNAVLVCRPVSIVDFKNRIEAITYFQALPEAAALSLANKRVNNLLAKTDLSQLDKFNIKYCKEHEEKILAQEIIKKQPIIAELCKTLNYKEALKTLSELKPAVDNFFDKIMVMDENQKLRHNRLALLKDLYALFISVADISLL